MLRVTCAMSPALRVLCALCALCAPSALCAGVGSGASADYCSLLRDLKLEQGRGSSIATRVLSESGAARRLRLASSGAAPRAAHELFRALLLHALRYRDADVRLGNSSTLSELAVTDEHAPEDEFILSVASAWGSERAADAACATRVCGVAGARLSVLARGAAPVARRLLARLAPGAGDACLRHWAALRGPECRFLHVARTPVPATPASYCPLSTCPPGDECVTVVLGAHEDATEECARARALDAHANASALPLRFVWLPDADLRAALRISSHSFLFVDYDLWADGGGTEERVWPAPPLPPRAVLHRPVSLVVADARKLTLYAPEVLQLALKFQPPAEMLRRQLADEATLGPARAACKAALDFRSSIGEWLACDDDFCDPMPNVRVYVCAGRDNYYSTIKRTVNSYWRSNFNNMSSPTIQLRRTDCSDVNKVNLDVQTVIYNITTRARLYGVAAMGGASASALPATARSAHVPLLLVDEGARARSASSAGAALGEGARSTTPAVAALAGAVRALLARCDWRRVLLLREEGRCDMRRRSLGVGEALRDAAELVVSEHVVQAGDEDVAVHAALASDARVVLVDASAPTAAGVLRAAQARALAPAAGYMWLVIGAAGDAHDEDWRPSLPGFSYVTLSGGWRGGAAPRGLGGAPALRAALDAALGGAWSPHAAPLADAMLLLLEGAARLRRARPQHRHDPHHPNTPRLFFELLNNVSGVTHDIRANASPPVFAHRLNARGVELVGVWHAPGVAEPLAPCAGVRDGPVCYTTRIGDRFSPHCLDVACAVLACVAALGPPALWVAHAARRRRLRRRDRRVERRALLRAGHSAAEAAAAAALAEHAVARAALRLLDELGGGHYGDVRLAVLRRAGGEALAVAAKAPRPDAPADAAGELLREAALLATLRHERVVRFEGVCLEGGPLVLMEHAFHGDLRRYLRARRPLAERARAGLTEPEAAHVAAPALTRMAREAAAALSYLVRQRLVHRDVRAANCLVDARRSLKLADFGMARRLGETGADEYLCRRRAMFPVLWMAPESLARGVFSAATDVWALGVLLLELATLGERPFGAWAAPRVLRHVRAGGTPPLPRDAAPCTRGVAAACWRRAARERPAAAELVAYLAEHPRAVQPALELLPGTAADADADAGAPTTPDSGLYLDEWTVN